jgi:hypothetical protein
MAKLSCFSKYSEVVRAIKSSNKRYPVSRITKCAMYCPIRVCRESVSGSRTASEVGMKEMGMLKNSTLSGTDRFSPRCCDSKHEAGANVMKATCRRPLWRRSACLKSRNQTLLLANCAEIPEAM